MITPEECSLGVCSCPYIIVVINKQFTQYKLFVSPFTDEMIFFSFSIRPVSPDCSTSKLLRCSSLTIRQYLRIVMIKSRPIAELDRFRLAVVIEDS